MLSFVVFVLTALEVLTALLLIGIILIQQSKAGGGLGAVGGGVTETVFGATAGNVLTRGTVILASAFFVITLLLAIITGQSDLGSSVADGIKSEVEAVEPTPQSAETEAPVPAEAVTDKAASKVEPAVPSASSAEAKEGKVSDTNTPDPVTPAAPSAK